MTATEAQSTEALEVYGVALARLDPSVDVEADLHTPTTNLIASLGGDGVRVSSEHSTFVGRPDLMVSRARRECVVGWVELKNMDGSADPRRFKSRHDRDQWERFQVLPNLVYSNGYGATLWRDGVQVGELASQSDDEAWGALWEEFLSYTPTVDPHPVRFAVTMGRRVRLLRDAVKKAFDGGSDHLRDTLKLWRDHLLPDLTEKRFVDDYAQMPMAGLLLARGLQPDGSSSTFGMSTAQDTLRNHGHGALAELLLHVDTAAGPEAAVCLSALSDAAAALDPSIPSDDGWWADFYEAFLDNYDRQLKNDMGVFYTPKEIVDYQIRATDWALRNHLDINRGFASEGVVTLDPACGTGTYLARLIEYVAGQTATAFGEGTVGEDVRRAAEGMYGFEIMAGPYTVARMRLAAKCAAHEVVMDRDRVFLTDTLSVTGQNRTIDMFAQQMAEEQAKANRVKDPETRVTVVIGNPPYDRDQTQAGATAPDRARRFGGMIRHGERVGELGLINDFREKTPPAMRQQFQMVYELATYFWRWAVWKVCEQTHPGGMEGGPGVVSYITPSAWIRSDPWAGMRDYLRSHFDHIWVVDLGGDQRLPHPDGENVFPIQTPVCITVAVRTQNHSDTPPATVHYRKIAGITRTEKLAELGDITLGGNGWEPTPTSPSTATFTPPRPETTYSALPAVDEVLPWKSPGAKYNRRWPIALTKDVLQRRWERLMAAPMTGDPEKDGGREELFKLTDRTLSSQVDRLDGGPPDPPIQDLPTDAAIPQLARYGHRPFCLRWAIADNRFGDRLRPPLWQAHSPEQAYLVTTKKTEAAGDGPTAVVYTHIPDNDSHHGYGGGLVLPLWRNKEATDANADANTVTRLSEQYDHQVTGQQVWYYTAGLLGTDAYPRFWAEPMKATLRPHIPFPDTHTDFIALTEVGKRLVEIARGQNLDDSGVRCTTAVDPSRLPTFTPRKCYHPDDEAFRLGGGKFTGVTAELWNHQISRYLTLQRWIRARSVNPGGRTTSPLDREKPTEWTFTSDLIVVCHKIASLNNAAQVAHPILERMSIALTN